MTMDISTRENHVGPHAETNADHSRRPIAPFSGSLLKFDSDADRAAFRQAVGQSIRAGKLRRTHRLVDYPGCTAATTMTPAEINAICNQRGMRFVMQAEEAG